MLVIDIIDTADDVWVGKKIVVIARLDGCAVGVLNVEDSDSKFPFIKSLFVNASRRRNGIGKKILDTAVLYIFTHCSDAIGIGAGIHTDNFISKKTFLSAGFSHVFNYDDNVQLWILRRE